MKILWRGLSALVHAVYFVAALVAILSIPRRGHEEIGLAELWELIQPDAIVWFLVLLGVMGSVHWVIQRSLRSPSQAQINAQPLPRYEPSPQAKLSDRQRHALTNLRWRMLQRKALIGLMPVGLLVLREGLDTAAWWTHPELLAFWAVSLLLMVMQMVEQLVLLAQDLREGRVELVAGRVHKSLARRRMGTLHIGEQRIEPEQLVRGSDYDRLLAVLDVGEAVELTLAPRTRVLLRVRSLERPQVQVDLLGLAPFPQLPESQDQSWKPDPNKPLFGPRLGDKMGSGGLAGALILLAVFGVSLILLMLGLEYWMP